MKSIALQVPVSSHHAGLWTLFRGFFRLQTYQGITRDQAHPKGPEKKPEKELVFFKEGELEDYIRSFRD